MTKQVLQHTPGPWVSIDAHGKYNPDHDWYVHNDEEETTESAAVWAGDTVVALVVAAGSGWNFSNPEFDANARLIAAAPELLEALQSLLREHDAVFSRREDGAKDSYYNAHPGRATAYRKARAVIAKATGEA